MKDHRAWGLAKGEEVSREEAPRQTERGVPTWAAARVENKGRHELCGTEERQPEWGRGSIPDLSSTVDAVDMATGDLNPRKRTA